jgi:hypothetical protein
MNLVTNGLLIGTQTSPRDTVDCRDCSADPTVLQDALGVTWDCLDLCLAYGLTGEEAKALLTVDASPYSLRKRLSDGAVSGGNGGNESGVGNTTAGDRGIVPEVRDRLVFQDGAKNVVDRRVHGAVPRFLRGIARAFRRMKAQRLPLHALQQAGEPDAFPALHGDFGQQSDGDHLKGSSGGGVRHGVVPHLTINQLLELRGVVIPRHGIPSDMMARIKARIEARLTENGEATQ